MEMSWRLWRGALRCCMVLAVPLQNYSSELGIALGGARTPQVERENCSTSAAVYKQAN